MERIQKDLSEIKEFNYIQHKFKILIFTLLYQNGSYKYMSVFSDYMYFRRIGFTPERLSTISDQEFHRLSVKKILNKLKPNTKLREIAEKIQYDYNGEVPENASELGSLLIDGKRGTCF